MPNDLQPLRPAMMRSLPLHLAKHANSLATVKWPGQPTRFHLPMGWELTETQRDEARALLAEFKAMANGTYRGQQDIAKDRLALLTKMLLGYPIASNVSEVMADARLDSYNDALSDVPPWAIDAALKRWGRGEGDHLGMGPLNYSFPPAPAVLCRLCRHEMEPLLDKIQKLERLLSAVSIERAMDPAPLPARPGLSIVDQTGRKHAIGLKRM